jgi:nickel-dependent lactate racemase
MAKFSIPYHTTTLALQITDRNLAYYIGLESQITDTDNQQVLLKAFQDTGKNSIEELISDRHVGWIIEDATRDVPLSDLLQATGSSLTKAALITLFLATGTHDGDTDGNRRIIDQVKQNQKKFGYRLNQIIINNCHQKSFYLAGETQSTQNQIFVHEKAQEVDLFLVFSDMKNHYFAGYSNALKNFMPGICNYATTERNHALALDERSTSGAHPLHPNPKRRNNPLARDIWQAYQLITAGRPAFVIATISKKEHILWAGAGLLEEIVPVGIQQVDRLMSETVMASDKLIVSCGGYPNDESLYAAQRALELAKNGVKKGGQILFIAACANGIGPKKSIDNFFNPLQKDIGEILKSYQNKYVMYAHKTYKFAQLIKSVSQLYILSQLDHNLMRSIHLKPITEAQEIINQWLHEDPNTTIGIVADGNKFALHDRG